ncbi:MAG: SMP-30/gluconolactonase/LRE family protein [Caldilineaceae bacterium]|nr:SMP-30/gluconolactonase/LRE family protein [Caldilineaceae bacterium]
MESPLKLDLIADYACQTGENPLWHAGEGCVYWVDIPPGKLFRYDPRTEEHGLVFQADGPIGGFTVESDGALLLFMGKGAVARWTPGTLTPVIDALPGEEESRFNDVIADPRGRVFCGTMSSPRGAGRLYRLDPGDRVTEILRGIGTSNGLGFTPDRTQLYYTDTRAQSIYLFDYDAQTGAIDNQRVFVTVEEDDAGHPDGLTVDAEGFVWSARWDGYCMVRYRPDGSEELRVELPAKKVSSLAFGGPDLTDIYVTTAGGDNKAENGADAGALFRVNLGIKGLPEFRSALRSG